MRFLEEAVSQKPLPWVMKKSYKSQWKHTANSSIVAGFLLLWDGGSPIIAKNLLISALTIPK